MGTSPEPLADLVGVDLVALQREEKRIKQVLGNLEDVRARITRTQRLLALFRQSWNPRLSTINSPHYQLLFGLPGFFGAAGVSTSSPSFPGLVGG